ncbi:MAG: vitamin K epoxide reductase family protein [bacterium]|nr:vitamin K epoxide reductase family protein [bacterium]
MRKIKTIKRPSLEYSYPFMLVIFGAVGVLTSLILTIEKFHKLENPTAALNCDINPIISCGSVIVTDQASAFGIPNPLIGLAGFSAVVTIGVMMILGAKVIKRWFWQAVLAGTAFGVVFIHWLIFQTIFRIGALCPWCMVTWAVMIPLFLYTFIYVVDQGYLSLGKNTRKIVNTIKREHVWILGGWFALILAVIIQRFWYFWQTLLP